MKLTTKIALDATEVLNGPADLVDARLQRGVTAAAEVLFQPETSGVVEVLPQPLLFMLLGDRGRWPSSRDSPVT